MISTGCSSFCDQFPYFCPILIIMHYGYRSTALPPKHSRTEARTRIKVQYFSVFREIPQLSRQLQAQEKPVTGSNRVFISVSSCEHLLARRPRSWFSRTNRIQQHSSCFCLYSLTAGCFFFSFVLLPGSDLLVLHHQASPPRLQGDPDRNQPRPATIFWFRVTEKSSWQLRVQVPTSSSSSPTSSSASSPSSPDSTGVCRPLLYGSSVMRRKYSL